MSWGGERALVHIGRCMWAWRLVVVHVGEKMRRSGRVVRSSRHLTQEIRRVDRLVVLLLLLLGVENVWIQRGTQELVVDGLALAQISPWEVIVEVLVLGVRDVEWVWGEVVALGPKMRGVVLRETLLRSLQEALVGQGGLLGILLGLGGGQELRIEAGGARGREGGRGIVGR